MSFINWAYKNYLKILLRAIYWPFFTNKLDGIQLAEPYNCQHQTSNQIEPVHLFLSSSLTTLLPPSAPAHSNGGGSTQDENMTNVKHINCSKDSHKNYV
jgi:hypothetical protein